MSTSARKARLRSCLACKFVQSAPDFRDRGCPNCQDLLDMQGSLQRVTECTTATFDGLITLMQPEESWVAKWQRIEKRIPGLYAVKVTGQLLDEDRERLNMPASDS